MKMSLLLGLVMVEKAQYALHLMEETLKANGSVQIVDNMVGIGISPEAVATGVTYLHVAGDIRYDLALLVEEAEVDHLIIAVSEHCNLPALFSEIANFSFTHSDLTVECIGLIDLRTCDCFPNLRELLERECDHIITLGEIDHLSP
ncbi:hypothetical protein MASR2M15_10710 [Anaerolineales bacterium]